MDSDENRTPGSDMNNEEEQADIGEDDTELLENDDAVDGGGDFAGKSAVEEEEEEELEEEDDLNAALNSDRTRFVTVAVPPQLPVVQTAEIVPESMVKRPRIVEDDERQTIGERRIQPPQTQQGDDQARKLFQRLWTDEDEIGLLQGFLDYSMQNNPHDTALFYDQIKSKLLLDFNKNQLVEKLRRLKKKYRNVLARISSGKEISFKSAHDQATFEVASKIWGSSTTHNSKDHIQQPHQQRRVDFDDDMPPNFNPKSTNLNLNFSGNFNCNHSDIVMDERMSQQKSKKRIRVKMEDSRVMMEKGAARTNSSPAHIPGFVEETVKNRITPMFREIYERSGGRWFGDGIVNPVPLSFASPVNLFGMQVADDRWRKQHIRELEVYSKRLELVQEQIKLTLDQLRSMGS